MASVAFAYVHPDAYSAAWVSSYRAFWRHDLRHEGHVFGQGCELDIALGTSGGLPAARNQGVRETLEVPGMDWLFWTDTDMGWEPDALDRLLAVADPVERPVVGALCFALRSAGRDGRGGHHYVPVPTIYDFRAEEGAFESRVDYASHPEVQRCDATGSAFVLIHRRVLEAMPEDSWYEPLLAQDGTRLGEDLSFCIRCGELGIPVHVHAGVEASHDKRVQIGSVEFELWRRAWAAGAEGRLGTPCDCGRYIVQRMGGSSVPVAPAGCPCGRTYEDVEFRRSR